MRIKSFVVFNAGKLANISLQYNKVSLQFCLGLPFSKISMQVDGALMSRPSSAHSDAKITIN